MATTTTPLPAHSDPNYTQYAQPTDWAVQFLIAGGIPVTKVNIAIIKAWAQSEGSIGNNNPLATGGKGPGATVCIAQCAPNKYHIYAYSTLAQGIEYNISWMRQNQPQILQALQGQAGWYEYSGNGLKGDKAANYSTQIAAVFSTINASGWCKGCQSGRYPIDLFNLSANTVDNYISGGPSVGQLAGAAADSTAVKDVTKPVTQAVKAATSWTTALGNFFSDITTAKFWLRVGMMFLGFALCIVGVVFILSETKVGQAAESAAVLSTA